MHHLTAYAARLILVAILALAATAALTIGADRIGAAAHGADVAARAIQVEPPDRPAGVKLRLTYVERTGPRRVFAEFSNGAAYRFTPCRFEDSRNCYWDARRMGNGRGRSHIDLRGTTYRLPAGSLR